MDDERRNDERRNDVGPSDEVGNDEVGNDEVGSDEGGSDEGAGDGATPLDPEATRLEVERRKRLYSGVDWDREVRPRLTQYARGRLRKDLRQHARDIADQAIAQQYMPAYKAWNEDEEPDLFDHLRSVVNGLAQNKETLAENKGGAATADVGGEVDGAGAALADPHAREESPEKAAGNRELMLSVIGRVQNAYGTAGAKVLFLLVESPEAQARALGISVEEAGRLKRNVLNYCRKLKAELGVDADVFRRVVKSAELLAMEKEIASKLPWHVRARGEIMLAIAFVVAVGVVLAFWYFSGRH